MTDAKSWFKAAKDGDAKELAALLEKNKELLNARDEDFKSYSALAHAAVGGHAEAASFLIKQGADIQHVNKNENYRLLWQVCSAGHASVVKLLLDAGAKVNEQFVLDGWTALMYAAVKNHVEVVKVLLAAGADPNIRTNATKLGRTALIQAEAELPKSAEVIAVLKAAEKAGVSGGAGAGAGAAAEKKA